MAKKLSPAYATGFRQGMKVGKNTDPDFVRGFNHGRKTATMLEAVSKPGRKPTEAAPVRKRGRVSAGASAPAN